MAFADARMRSRERARGSPRRVHSVPRRRENANARKKRARLRGRGTRHQVPPAEADGFLHDAGEAD